ncbi:MAG: hypothetical protein MUE96_07265 [Bacteroidia bacterium]|jgi:hypothetical protein|nr:hypothetical protein [Bacteroidia bacterium]
MDEKICLQCGAPLKGRIDKKFCDDQCRTSYNNRHNHDSPLMRSINSSLRRNRKIMMNLVPESTGKTKVPRQRLLQLGFDFTYYTHEYTTRSGAVYHFCYEYGYLPLGNDYVVLVKQKQRR